VLLVVLALLLSGLASFALLRRQREDMGSALGELARLRRERAAARLAAEDQEMEAFAPDGTPAPDGGPEPDGTPGPDGTPARDEEDPDAERDGADTARRSGYHDWTASGQERP
jgi:AraC-like DNA-binding protein